MQLSERRRGALNLFLDERAAAEVTWGLQSRVNRRRSEGGIFVEIKL